jgi:hypothetical protein
MSTQPRGLRLHNPGNLRHGRDNWQGKAAEQPDADFVAFKAPQYGIRAIARTILTYDKKGVNTVRGIINRWAPPTENNSEAYIAHVAQVLGVEPDDWLDLDTVEVMRPLVETIILHENGRQPYKPQVILDGLRMAGVADAPAKPLAKKGAFVTQATTATATTLGLVASVSEPVKKAADGLEPFSGSPIIGQIVIGLLTLAGAAALAGTIGTWLQHRKGL